jgi:hypothetical protein
MKHETQWRSISASDRRLIIRLAIALADFYGESLCEKHFAEAMRLLCRKGGPLADHTTKEIALPDLGSLVASAEFLADANDAWRTFNLPQAFRLTGRHHRLSWLPG